MTNIKHSSNTYEWYTPKEYLRSAQRVMGSITLDPASCETANRMVKAQTYFTKEEDGLDCPWFGNVWLNPPYGRGITNLWVEKLIKEWEKGRLESAIILTNPATETKWFQKLLNHADAMCFTDHRINFIDESGEQKGSPAHGNVFTGFFWPYDDGTNKFALEFIRWGTIVSL